MNDLSGYLASQDNYKTTERMVLRVCISSIERTCTLQLYYPGDFRVAVHREDYDNAKSTKNSESK